ncbi:MAG TPA: hypothetical protein VN829_03655 [Dongiaceae bacterium]|nr:hypothetical protein [Dongiaceae bacterium]
MKIAPGTVWPSRRNRELGMEESLRRRSGAARLDYTFALTPACPP